MRVERGALGNLVGRDFALEQAGAAVAALAMTERYVTRLAGRQREREAA